MKANIKTITFWVKGINKSAVIIDVVSASDNLIDKAVFSYALKDNKGINLSNGQIECSGQDYKDWNSAPDINTWALNYVVDKLNLIIVN